MKRRNIFSRIISFFTGTKPDKSAAQNVSLATSSSMESGRNILSQLSSGQDILAINPTFSHPEPRAEPLTDVASSISSTSSLASASTSSLPSASSSAASTEVPVLESMEPARLKKDFSDADITKSYMQYFDSALDMAHRVESRDTFADLSSEQKAKKFLDLYQEWKDRKEEMIDLIQHMEKSNNKDHHELANSLKQTMIRTEGAFNWIARTEHDFSKNGTIQSTRIMGQIDLLRITPAQDIPGKIKDLRPHIQFVEKILPQAALQQIEQTLKRMERQAELALASKPHPPESSRSSTASTSPEPRSVASAASSSTAAQDDRSRKSSAASDTASPAQKIAPIKKSEAENNLKTIDKSIHEITEKIGTFAQLTTMQGITQVGTLTTMAKVIGDEKLSHAAQTIHDQQSSISSKNRKAIAEIMASPDMNKRLEEWGADLLKAEEQLKALREQIKTSKLPAGEKAKLQQSVQTSLDHLELPKQMLKDLIQERDLAAKPPTPSPTPTSPSG